MDSNSPSTVNDPAELKTPNTPSMLTYADAKSLPPRPPLGKKKPSRPASDVWDHFVKIEDSDPDDPRCECIYCGRDYACGSKKCGTSTLRNHLNNQCKKYPYRIKDKKQKTLTFERKADDSGLCNLVATGFNNEACRMACAKMIVLDELPFSFVEGHGFRHFCSVACPKFDPPSRRTIVRDIYQLYLDEKLALKSMFIAKHQRVSLTTVTWTSIQNVSYMSLTAHFIDDEWILHKRILNFCVVPNHKEETIGKVIEICLHDWGLEKVFTITLDNASANNSVVAYLKRKMINWKSYVLDGEFLHVRCSAHIVNLIVCEGLKELHDSIASIRNSVRYVRSSPSRLQKFKECINQEKIESKALVVLDVPTRWNSTYMMLESAMKFQKAFERLEEEDGHFSSYFGEDDSGKKVGPPKAWHWDNAKAFVQFLKGYYDVTLKFSSSVHVTSNIYFHHVSSIQKQLYEFSVNGDSRLCYMARKMREKYDKYWGSMGNVNKLLLIAAVLDPRYKLDYVSFSYGMLYDNDEVIVNDLTNGLKDTLMRLFEWYKEKEVASESSSSQVSSSTDLESTTTSLNSDSGLEQSNYADKVWIAYLKKREQSKSNEIKNDVDRYLMDPCEAEIVNNFDILNWWRVNGSKYPILEKLAKDVYAIQVSTMASESAFSTERRILDPFRSSLTAKMVEALICCQNWLKVSPPVDRFFLEDVEYYDKLDAELCQTTETTKID